MHVNANQYILWRIYVHFAGTPFGNRPFRRLPPCLALVSPPGSKRHVRKGAESARTSETPGHTYGGGTQT